MIKANEEFIIYAELALSQSFQRGKSPISTDKIQELTMFTLFYVGEELLQLKQRGNPSPVYQLIKILINIYSSDEPMLGEEKISSYYTLYGNTISNALGQKTIKGVRLGVKYSIIEYQDGLCFSAVSDSEKKQSFIPETNQRVIKLLKLIYHLKIQDHKITMSIFDYDVLTEIIQLIS